jgi:membrane-associated phospholipid phosphatase
VRLPIRPTPGPLRSLGPVAVLAALVVAALGAHYAGHGTPGAVDGWLGPTEDRLLPPWGYVALAVDFCGEPVGATILISAAVAACLLLRRFRAAVLTLAGVGLTVAATSLLKHVVGRTIHGAHLSFPSGHTGMATALALVTALVAADLLRLGRAATTLLAVSAASLAGAAMGWAEVSLGAHYPTDALGGYCTALAVVPAAAWVVNRVAAGRAPGIGADQD